MSIVKWWCPLSILVLAGAGCHARPPVIAPTRARRRRSFRARPRPLPHRRGPPPAPPLRRPAIPKAKPKGSSSAATLDDLNAEHPLGDAHSLITTRTC